MKLLLFLILFGSSVNIYAERLPLTIVKFGPYHFENRLRMFRKETGLSLEYSSRLTELSFPTLVRWERGESLRKVLQMRVLFKEFRSRFQNAFEVDKFNPMLVKPLSDEINYRFGYSPRSKFTVKTGMNYSTFIAIMKNRTHSVFANKLYSMLLLYSTTLEAAFPKVEKPEDLVDIIYIDYNLK